MAARDSAPAISLFSFQDIITSITGIMFLVVLLLMLLVLEIDPKKAKPAAPRDPEAAAQLEELRKLRRDLAAAKKSAETLNQSLAALRALKLDEIELRRKELEWQIVVLREKEAAENAAARTAEKEAEKQKSRRDALSQSKTKLTQRRTELKETLDRKQKEVETLQKQLDGEQKLVHYSFEGSSAKTPVLVEFDGSSIRTRALADGSEHVFEASGKDFLSWAMRQDKSAVYFLLLARPETFLAVEQASGELDRLGFERGREVLPDENATIFTTGGRR